MLSVWVPTVRDEVLKVAVEPEIVANPTIIEPSLNVTEPVAPVVTVAVNVTVSEYDEGLAELARLTELLALFTVSVSVEDVLLL